MDEEVYTDARSHYDLYRMAIGLLEGGQEMGNQFPLNINLHQLNGVSFSKGCYIGQELTQRTYHTGVVRKVALPFLIDSLPNMDDIQRLKIHVDDFSPLNMIDEGFDEDLAGQEIKDSKGKRLGKILASRKNLGIAVVDLMKMGGQDGQRETFTVEGQRTLLWQPVWMNVALENDSEMSAAE